MLSTKRKEIIFCSYADDHRLCPSHSTQHPRFPPGCGCHLTQALQALVNGAGACLKAPGMNISSRETLWFRIWVCWTEICLKSFGEMVSKSCGLGRLEIKGTGELQWIIPTHGKQASGYVTCASMDAPFAILTQNSLLNRRRKIH